MARSTCWLLLGASLSSVAVACNSGSGGGGGGGGGGRGMDSGSPTTDGATPVDGATTPEGSAADTGTADDGGGADSAATEAGTGANCGEAPDAGGLPYTGFVGLSRVTDGTAAAVYEALGQFETSATAPSSGTCTGTKVGACCYGTTTGTAPTPASAGDITITDGAKTLVTLMSPGYAATSATDATLTWAAGATLKITAAGATVDGFTTDIVAPAPFAALTPAFGTTLDVSTSKDLVVTWTPGKGACNQISFGLTQGTGMPNIDCIVDDSAGTLTVPKSLLGMLTAASGTVVIERVIGKKLLAPNAGMSVAAIEVVETQTTYTP